MDQELSKAQVLDTLQAERRKWDTLLAEVDAARMTEPIEGGWWSVKDIIDHIAWHEQEIAAVLQPRPTSPTTRRWLWELLPDKRNAILFTERRQRALPEVLADAQEAFQQLVAAVQALTPEDVQAVQALPNIPTGGQPWKLIADHSYNHYQPHMRSIRAWLDSGIAGWAKP
jgi:hypothetical protein